MAMDYDGEINLSTFILICPFSSQSTIMLGFMPGLNLPAHDMATRDLQTAPRPFIIGDLPFAVDILVTSTSGREPIIMRKHLNRSLVLCLCGRTQQKQR
jgi:hypothetical protein